MARRRKQSQVSSQPHWLIVTDRYRNVVECTALPERINLQQALQAAVVRWIAEGWESEGDCSYDFCFVRRAQERMLLNVTAADPSRPQTAGHAFLAGRGSNRDPDA